MTPTLIFMGDIGESDNDLQRGEPDMELDKEKGVNLTLSLMGDKG